MVFAQVSDTNIDFLNVERFISYVVMMTAECSVQGGERKWLSKGSTTDKLQGSDGKCSSDDSKWCRVNIKHFIGAFLDMLSVHCEMYCTDNCFQKSILYGDAWQQTFNIQNNSLAQAYSKVEGVRLSA